MLWIGATDAAQEVVKERAVLERERAIGVKLRAYVASKLIVLFGLVTVQTVLYSAILFAFRPFDAGAGAWLAIFALLIATGCAAVCMGLAISGFAGTPDQSMSFVPLAVIPQLLFAGAIVPVAAMAEPAQSDLLRDLRPVVAGRGGHGDRYERPDRRVTGPRRGGGVRHQLLRRRAAVRTRRCSLGFALLFLALLLYSLRERPG